MCPPIHSNLRAIWSVRISWPSGRIPCYHLDPLECAPGSRQLAGQTNRNATEEIRRGSYRFGILAGHRSHRRRRACSCSGSYRCEIVEILRSLPIQTSSDDRIPSPWIYVFLRYTEHYHMPPACCSAAGSCWSNDVATPGSHRLLHPPADRFGWAPARY